MSFDNFSFPLNSTMMPTRAGEGRDEFYYYEDIDRLTKAWTKEPHFLPLVIIYGSVFLIGIIGNAVVICSVFGGRNGRSVTFTFMVSLAIADILFLLVVVPHEILRMVLGSWSGGRAFCKISGFIEILTTIASILNLTAVSFERYFVIVMPMKSRRKCTFGNTRRILIAVWVASVILSTPTLYIKFRHSVGVPSLDCEIDHQSEEGTPTECRNCHDTETTTYYNNETAVSLMHCSDHGLRDDQRIYYAIYQFLIMFILPTIMMIYCYTVVIYVLWISGRTLINMTSTYRLRSFNIHHVQKSTAPVYSSAVSFRRRNVVSETVPSAQVDVCHSVIKRRKQVIRMLITVILVFLVCWGPKLLFQIFKYSNIDSSIYSQIHFNLQLVMNCMPYIQSCINPFIYCVMSKSFRKSVVTSCNIQAHKLHCNGRRSTLQEFEMESKVNGATWQTLARASRSTSD